MDRYAVVGNPVAHSKSPEIHQLFAEQTHQQLEYHKMCLTVGTFNEEVCGFFALGGKGLNVTVPFKENAFTFADELSDRARLAGAVNTLILLDSGAILGDTTDGAGLSADLLRLGWSPTGRRILILGAGGAVRGIMQPLLALQPESITIANRTEAKAVAIAEAFRDLGEIKTSAYAALPSDAFDLIINGTSASLAGALPSLPAGVVNAHTQVYDMMYAAQPTGFLQWAAEQGATDLSDGLGMLVGQAAESFFLWRGVRPDVGSVITCLRQRLQASLVL